MDLGRRQVITMLAVLTSACYLNALGNDFVWDDQLLVCENSFIRNHTYLSTAFTTELFHSYPTGTARYRPLQTVSYMIDYFLWGLNPYGYHLTNLLLHLACGVLVWMLVEKLGGSRTLGLFVAALFAVHPIATNAVTYISGRADSLAFTAMLGSLLLFIGYRRTDLSAVLVRIALYAGSVGCFVAALLSRENALLLPLLILLYCLILDRRGAHNVRDGVKSVAPFVLVALVFLWWRFAVLGLQTKPLLPEQPVRFAAQAQIVLRTVATYVGLLLWPTHLQMERQVVSGNAPWLHFLTVAGIVGACGVAMLTGWAYRVSRLAFFGMSWFLGTVIPMTGILNLSGSVAEHWLYVPSVGLFLGVGAICANRLAASASRLNAVRRIAICTCVLVLIALAARTMRRNTDWANELTLFEKTRQDAPDSVRARIGMGRAYLAAGELQRAMSELLEAERLYPRDTVVKANLAAVYFAQGNFDAALRKDDQCLRLDPQNSSALLQRAIIHKQRGDFALAKRDYLAAIATARDLQPRLLFGTFLLEQQKIGEALRVAEEAVKIEPGNAEARFLLADALAEQGSYREAERAYKTAATLDRHSRRIDEKLGQPAVSGNRRPVAEPHNHSGGGTTPAGDAPAGADDE
jgi:Flp pilus assembly protein TadD